MSAALSSEAGHIIRTMASNPARSRAALVVVIATVLSFLVLVLPLTPRVGPIGRWGSYLMDIPGPVRVKIGITVAAGTPILIPIMGLLFLRRDRTSLAAGVFVATAAITLEKGVTQPLLVGPRPQPFIAALLLVASSIGYALGALILVREEASRREAAVPPPPRPI